MSFITQAEKRKDGLRSFQAGLLAVLFACGVVGCSDAPPRQTRAPLSFKQEANREQVTRRTQELSRPDPSNLPSSLTARGKSYRELKECDLAIADLKEAIGLKPDHAPAYRELALCYEAQKLPKEERIARGWGEYYEGSYQRAIATFTVVLQMDQKNAEAYFGRGKSYLRTNNGHLHALGDLEAATRFNVGLTNAHLELGKLYRSLGKIDEAIASLSRVIDKGDSDSVARYERGFAYLTKKDLSKAIMDFDFILRVTADNLDAREGRAFAYLSLGKVGQALDDATNILKRAPDRMASLFVRGASLARKAKYAEAIRDLDRAVRASPNLADAALKIYGRIEEEQGPRFSVVQAAGVAKYQLGQFEEAGKLLSTALLNEGTTPQVLYDRGMVHIRRRHYAYAITDLEQALRGSGMFLECRLAPKLVEQIGATSRSGAPERNMGQIGGLPNANIYKNLAWAYYEERNEPKALQTLQRGSETLKGDPEALFLTGLLYARQDDLDKAITYVKVADSMAPGTSTPYRPMLRELEKAREHRDANIRAAAVAAGLAIILVDRSIRENRCLQDPECAEQLEADEEAEERRHQAASDLIINGILAGTH